MDADAPMTDAEFRVVREWLGLDQTWLGRHLDVQDRTVRRWEAGTSPVPDGVRVTIEGLERIAADHVDQLVDELGRTRGDPVLRIPRTDAEAPAVAGQQVPAAWWRAIAARCAHEVPDLAIEYRA